MTALTVPDALELCRKMRMNLTQLQGQLTDVMESLAVLPADAGTPKAKCGMCGVQMRGPNALAEHVHLSHGGPVPPGWLRAEEMAGLAEIISPVSPEPGGHPGAGIVGSAT